MTPLLAFYGDDFTGSTDAMEFLTRAGARTVLFTRTPDPAQLARFPDLAAVGVAGFTRALPPAEMEAELRPAFTALRQLGAPHVHYKVCSTFDSSPTVGSIGRAIDIGAEVFGGRFVPLVVGAPALGRYCVFGNLFARFGIGSTGEIHRLDRHPSMSRHPVTPADEADLRRHLARQTGKRSALIDVLALARPEPDRHRALEGALAAGAEVVLFDALDPDDLLRIGALLEPLGSAAAPLFSVGSSGIEMALGAFWQSRGRLAPRSTWADPGSAAPLLVVSGSCSPVTIAQIAHAVRRGFVDIAIEPLGGPEAVQAAVRSATAHLRAGSHVIVHSDPGRAPATEIGKPGGDPGRVGLGRPAIPAAQLGDALGRVARGTVALAGVRRVVVAGGDTSSYAARALGIEAVEMIAPLAPGAPLCRAHAPGSPADQIEINFKGGQVGAEDYFSAVAAGKV